MNRAYRALLRAFFPDRCPVCDRPFRGEGAVCPDCVGERLKAPSGAACPVCGLPLRDCVCGRRLYYQKAAFPFLYRGGVKNSVQKMKFRGRLDLVEPFAAEMCAAAERRGLFEDAELVTFVPARPVARFRRGYNQAEELARAVAKRAGLPAARLLVKCEKNETQHALPLSLRRGNMLGVFDPAPESEAQLAGKTVILVDDIMTSGNTLNEAAKTLMIFGAEKVYCLCAAARPRLKKPKPEKNA